MADDIVDVLIIGSGATGAGGRLALVDGLRAQDEDFMSRLALETVTARIQGHLRRPDAAHAGSKARKNVS
jgi:hypothetical protein